jgi:hypothetical protein
MTHGETEDDGETLVGAAMTVAMVAQGQLSNWAHQRSVLSLLTPSWTPNVDQFADEALVNVFTLVSAVTTGSGNNTPPLDPPYTHTITIDDPNELLGINSIVVPLVSGGTNSTSTAGKWRYRVSHVQPGQSTKQCVLSSDYDRLILPDGVLETLTVGDVLLSGLNDPHTVTSATSDTAIISPSLLHYTEDMHIESSDLRIASTKLYIPRPTIPVVTTSETQWVMTSHPTTPLEMNVGDMIRFGETDSHQFTDYVTVLEKRMVRRLGNFTTHPISWPYRKDGTLRTTSQNQSLIAFSGLNGFTGVFPEIIGITSLHQNHSDRYHGAPNNLSAISAADRLNKLPVINLLDDYPVYRIQSRLHLAPGASGIDALSQPNTMYTGATIRRTLPYIDRPVGSNDEDYRLHPVYKLNTTVVDGVLRCKLEENISHVYSVKLIGYTMNKKHIRRNNDLADEIVVVSIDELPGEVVSNHATCNRAFAVLNASHSGKNETNNEGTTSLHAYDPHGIAEAYFMHVPSKTIRQLTFRFKNWRGEPARLGRIHLWLKLSVSKG